MKLKITSSLLLILITVTFQQISFAENVNITIPLTCSSNSNLQLKKSIELERLYTSDQSDREKIQIVSTDDFLKLSKNDLERRKRVAEIFAEGCLKTSNDYKNAAIIFQHGDVPDHYYQAFIFANKSAELGDQESHHLASLAIDRYLISIGHKQLFGSQYFNSNVSRHNQCFCMQPVEKSFPDSYRISYAGRSLNQSYTLLQSINKGKDCSASSTDCKSMLKPTPRGSVKGLW